MSGKRDALIIGAGPAGLAAAHRLLSKGWSVRLIDAAARAGGHTRSEPDGDYLIEYGPHTFRGEAGDLWTLLEEIDLAESVAAMDAQAPRFIYKDRRLHALPQSLGALIKTKLLCGSAKGRALLGMFRAGDNQARSVADWFDHRLGRGFRQAVIDPFIGGIFAGDSKELDVAYAFPNLWARTGPKGRLISAFLRRSKKSERAGIFALPGGFGQIADRLTNTLGDRLILNCAVTQITRADEGGYRVHAGEQSWHTQHLVIATPAPSAARLLDSLDPRLGQPLRGIHAVPMAAVYLGGPGAGPLPKGFGALIAPEQGLRMLGAINVAALMPERAPTGHWLVTAFFGGRRDEEISAVDDEKLLAHAQTELQRLSPHPLRVDLARLHRYAEAIPQPSLNHASILEQLQTRLSAWKGLHLAGSYLLGVSVDQAVRSGFTAAQQLAEGQAA